MKRIMKVLMKIELAAILVAVMFSLSFAIEPVKKSGIQAGIKGIPGKPSKLPDLIVSDIKLIKDCQIQITIKNIGNAGLPDSAYNKPPLMNTVIQMYNGNQPWGGVSLFMADPAGILKNPGTSVTYDWMPGSLNLHLTPGIHTIKAEVDAGNAVAESNETNNSRTERLICKKPEAKQPDLIVGDINLIKECQIQITIKNIGNAGVPDSGYHKTQGAAIQMYNGNQPWGGVRLFMADPSKVLKTPGSGVTYNWLTGSTNLYLSPGTHLIKVIVDNNNAVAESNETNNSRTERLVCKNQERSLYEERE